MSYVVNSTLGEDDEEEEERKKKKKKKPRGTKRGESERKGKEREREKGIMIDRTKTEIRLERPQNDK